MSGIIGLLVLAGKPMTFQVGDQVEVNDPSRSWAHTEPGVILATYPPGAEEPAEYELLVAGRPLILQPRYLKPLQP